MLRCLMINANLGHKYWKYTATMAPFLWNQTPTTTNQGMALSFEAMWWQKPNLSNLLLFGYKAQVHILDVFCGKLNAKMKDCIFLGYANGVKARIFEHVVWGQQFVLQDAIVRIMRFNLEVPMLHMQRRSLSVLGWQNVIQLLTLLCPTQVSKSTKGHMLTFRTSRPLSQ